MSDLGNRSIMAKNINFYIEKNHQSRRKVCKDLGFPYSTFTEWINGNAYPRIDKIEKMANYWGIEKSDLIENHDKVEKETSYHLEFAHENSVLHNSDNYDNPNILSSVQAFKLWREQIGHHNFTEEEIMEIANFTKFILSKRGDK